MPETEMNRSTHILLAAVLAAVLSAATASAQVLMRHVAEFRFGPEQASVVTAVAFPGPPDGTLIYTKTFTLPATQRTVFVTLSATGDTHTGNASWFSARVNGVLCNTGDEGAGFAPGGWVPLQKHFDYDNITYTSGGVAGQVAGDGGGGRGDMHDNGIYYTWCCINGLRPGAANLVEIKMATSFAGQNVFVERSHYYVDSVDQLLCNPAAPIPATTVSSSHENGGNSGSH
jgi:hypothetical protein